MNKVKGLDEVDEKEKIGIGSLWKLGNYYAILSQVGESKVCLVGFCDGNRFINPIEVDNVREITPLEWSMLADKSVYDTITRVHAIEIRTDK